MKRALLILAVFAGLSVAAGSASAHDYYHHQHHAPCAYGGYYAGYRPQILVSTPSFVTYPSPYVTSVPVTYPTYYPPYYYNAAPAGYLQFRTRGVAVGVGF